MKRPIKIADVRKFCIECGWNPAQFSKFRLAYEMLQLAKVNL